jgi:hypothetical protein
MRHHQTAVAPGRLGTPFLGGILALVHPSSTVESVSY